jgi:Zn-dependent protease with chaperone function
MNRALLLLLASLTTTGMTATVANAMPEQRRAAYEYSADEVNAAAKTDLDLVLAPFRLAGKLNRTAPEFERVHQLFAQVVDAARQRSDLARKLDWALYVHEGRLVEAYSRAGGKIVISAQFLQRYRPNDAELAFVIGHEVAHAVCEHERINLSAVWRRNAPQKLQARYAMEFIDTEPMVRAQLAPAARRQERVADRLGLELAAATGIDPVSALGFFDKSADEAQGGSLFPDMHDLPAARKAALLKAATSFRPVVAWLRARAVNCAP